MFQTMLQQESMTNPYEAFMFSVFLTIMGFAAGRASGAELSLDALLDMLALTRGQKCLSTNIWMTVSHMESPYRAMVVRSGEQTASIHEEVREHMAGVEAANQDSPYREEVAALQDGIYLSARAFDVRSAGRWPCLMSDEFFGLLKQYDSRALVVLSNYAIIMQAFHELWWIGSWGRNLLSAVDKVFPKEEQARLNWSMAKMEHLMEVHYPDTKQGM
ncbi:hypothetical protein LTR08_002054 [Meristemomyces frigidus]|nr:hypothetical protein LTR08_002054 [Meristemomyces frigidus]